MDGEGNDLALNYRTAVARGNTESGSGGEMTEDEGETMATAVDKKKEIADLGESVVGTGSEFHKKKDAKTQENKKAPEDPTVPFHWLFAFGTPYDHVLMIVGFVGAVVHGAALQFLFLFFGRLINALGSGGPGISHTVNKYALYFVYLGLINLGSAWLEVSCWMHTGERQASRMREEYLKALLRQEIAYFDTDASTGDFVNTISSDPLLVQDAISEKVGNFAHYMCTFIAGFILGFKNQWRIALVTLAVVPLIAVAGGFYAYVLTGVAAKASSSYSEAGNFAEQATSQVRAVYSFVGEERFVRSYGSALEDTTRLGAKGGLAKGLGMGVTYGVLFLCWATLLWYGGILVRKGETNGGEALATIFSVVVGSTALGIAAPNIGAFARGRVAAYKIFQMIEREPQMKRDAAGETLELVEGRIELRNVDFSYPSRHDVLIFKKFSLAIPSGKTVAIVGNSGSGKSTIVSLIERFYDPDAGEVLLDGRDLRTLDLTWLRSQIGLVNQEPALFATSILTNILYGKENADVEEMLEAAQAANARSFIEELPLGYQTQVGEKGIQLSGGQKQRVAIARAMLKNPKILLLDEATSALDAGSEQVVQEALNRLMLRRTTVIVAHRLSTIRNADSIAVVQEGHIVEMGTHDELISKEDGAYSALIHLQELAADTAASSDIDAAAAAAAAVGASKHSLSRSFRGKGSLSFRSKGSSSFRFLSNSFSQRRLSQDEFGSYRSLSSMNRGHSLSRSVGSENVEEPENAESKLRGKTSTAKAKSGSFSQLFAMSKPDWNFVLAGMIGSGLAGCLNPLYGYLLASTVAVYYNPDFGYMKHQISKFALIFVGMGFASPVIYSLQHYSLAVAGERLVKRVRERMFATILRNELGWFDEDENNSAQISARLASDATTVRTAIGDRVAIIVQNLTLLLIALTVGFVLQWKMTLVMLATIPIIAVCMFVDQLFLTGLSGDQISSHARATRVAAEAVANIRTVAAFSAESKIQELFRSELQGPARRSFIRGQSAGIGYGFSQFILYGAYALGLWYAGKLVSSGEASVTHAISVFIILVISSFAASETLSLSPDLVKGSRAMRSVFQVLDRKTMIEPDDSSGDKPNRIRGTIQFKDVHFAYPSRPDTIIFKNLNLRVRTGRRLALVGASGSGKSSIIALIERYYDPLSGQVLIDNKDLRTYNLRSIRSHIGLVQQEPALFDTSIMQNILYGKEGATEAEVIEAAKAANAHNFISALPDGYKTQVGDRGIQLSGGQKQRVAIARAVLKNPAILLLDEATSALDAESEKVVQEALDKLMHNSYRTSVVVAHRLSTIRNADSIAVVQDGNILEEGSHVQLVERRGAYSQLLNIQNRVQESQDATAARMIERD